MSGWFVVTFILTMEIFNFLQQCTMWRCKYKTHTQHFFFHSYKFILITILHTSIILNYYIYVNTVMEKVSVVHTFLNKYIKASLYRGRIKRIFSVVMGILIKRIQSCALYSKEWICILKHAITRSINIFNFICTETEFQQNEDNYMNTQI